MTFNLETSLSKN